MRLITLVLTFLLCVGRLAQAQWVPPVAVPMPTFGISEIPSAPTLYVNEAVGNDANPGTAVLPRRTIPTQLAAGTVVQVVGTYTTSHTSPYTLEAHGTALQPVYILGGTFTRGGQLTGSYVILDGGNGPGGWTIIDTRSGQTTDHVAVRHYTSDGGFATASFYGAFITDVTFYDVHVNTGYTNQTESDGDWHCVGVGKRSQRVWIVDSVLSNCNGDGVQVNGGQGGQLDTGPVYVGRVTCKHNRQSCVWAKQSVGVVFSTLDISDMRPGVGDVNPGVCGGAQYFAVGTLFYNLDCYDSENGIRIASYDTEALATPETAGIAIIGSRFHNIHARFSTPDPTNPQSPGTAIILVGASRRYLKDNVIDDVDAGIGVQSGTFEDINNTITNVGTVPPPPPPPDTRPLCSSINPFFPNRFFAILLGLCR